MFELIALLFLTTEVFAETRQKIVVVDTGVTQEQVNKPYMCEKGVLNAIKDDGLTVHPHGSNIVGLIGKQINIKKYCVLSIRYNSGYSSGPDSTDSLKKSFSMVLKEKNVLWVNVSVTGEGFDPEELSLVKKINEKNIGMSLAAGNEGLNLNEPCGIFPACYRLNVPNKSLYRVIGSSTSRESFKSNYGNIVTDKEDGVQQGTPALTGTSQATAIYTGKLFKE